MLMTDDSARKTRNNEKITQLLNFLKEETWSDLATMKQLFQYQADRPLHRLLEKVEGMGLIQKHVFKSRLGNLALWGITQDGIAVVINPDDKVFPSRFEPSKLKGWNIDHHLDNQLVRLILEQKGATDWINGDRSNFLSRFNVRHRPDGLITLPNGRQIAIETERSLKTKARYQQIIASHLKARTESQWFYVFYIVPDDQKKRALLLLFDTIKHVIENNQHVTLEAKHRNVFRFYTMDELKRLELTNYA
ncbi:molybdopterin-guanine dinucleotide biosynthesis protein MobC [Erwinia typographi]|uniref:Molybdopterin-guanine dinucleotide biosynthesis protein MobC n=1 Tax=Erwinia typographi TaxID=371042 RepID=A0A0A3YHP4_9GAMM|nr:MobC family replication-relaxation protein [Erwinia typographi]KGT86302.1 molybdopterin-guanine dinucleotide biosynthesis protein MobC [Erwinia typographi]